MFSKHTLKCIFIKKGNTKILKTVFIIPLLLSFLSSFSIADMNEAYEHLYGVMDRCHDNFYVYANHDDGCNHFYPSGLMGDHNSISFNTSWSANCHSGDSCIRVSFIAKGNNFAGLYWLEPENNWGNVPSGGYDLTGATRIIFWAKGENGGEKVKFFAGGVGNNAKNPWPDSFSQTSTDLITLTGSWKEYSIDLANKDLSHVIGGFGWSIASDDNPNGATFYLDHITYDKARQGDLRFLKSYETLSTKDPDKNIKNTAYIYDNALALLSFLARGNPEDLRRAKILADSFIYAINNDRYFTDGRLRNAYMSGDLKDHFTGKVRLPGWWNPLDNKWYEDDIQLGTHTGNLAWVMIALLSYHKKVGDFQYLEAAKILGRWIEVEAKDYICSGGYIGGYEGFEPYQRKVTWKSTEHNINVYVAFISLYEITNDLKWKNLALHAKNFLDSVWNETEKHFWTGTIDDGCTINKNNFHVDNQACAILALGSDYNSALKWAENNFYTEADGFKGFDFNNDKDGIWFEGTAQMALAYQISGDIDNSNFYISEIIKAQGSAPNNNGKGIIAASKDGLTTGFDWEYFSRLNIAATSWFIFAENRFNPYWSNQTTTISPIIQANGSNEPTKMGIDDTLIITIKLNNNGRSDNANWWIAVDTPFGFYFFSPVGWTNDAIPIHQGPLFYFDAIELLKIPVSALPQGIYTFYFAIDIVSDDNNKWNIFYYDSILIDII